LFLLQQALLYILHYNTQHSSGAQTSEQQQKKSFSFFYTFDLNQPEWNKE
jgi:hypothetical protein